MLGRPTALSLPFGIRHTKRCLLFLLRQHICRKPQERHLLAGTKRFHVLFNVLGKSIEELMG
jgi:hypothetical protein